MLDLSGDAPALIDLSDDAAPAGMEVQKVYVNPDGSVRAVGVVGGGGVKVGDTPHCVFPDGRMVFVQVAEVRVDDEKCDRATAGQRVVLGLTGVLAHQLLPGFVLLHDEPEVSDADAEARRRSLRRRVPARRG